KHERQRLRRRAVTRVPTASNLFARASTATALVIAVLAPTLAPAERRALADVRTFGYQLQNYDEAALQASPYDLLVIDTESEGGPWTAEQIAALRQGPCGPRIVLAYVSIGEAEDYRFYWTTLPPDLLAAENPK